MVRKYQKKGITKNFKPTFSELSTRRQVIVSAINEFYGSDYRFKFDDDFFHTGLIEPMIEKMIDDKIFIKYEEEDFNLYRLNIEVGNLDVDQLDKKDLYEMWQLFSAIDCMDHFKYYTWYTFSRSTISFSVMGKAHQMFIKCLLDYSVSEIVYLMYREFKKAAQYSSSNFMDYENTLFKIIKGIESYIAWAKKYNYEIHKFGRSFNVEYLFLPRYFFEKVLGIGELGFTMPPQSL